MKISLYAALPFAAATFLAGLTVGWVLTGQAGWSLVGLNGEGSGGTPAHEAAHTVEEPPPAVAPEMPSEARRAACWRFRPSIPASPEPPERRTEATTGLRTQEVRAKGLPTHPPGAYNIGS